MGRLAVEDGLPVSQVVLETRAQNTWQNVEYSLPFLEGFAQLFVASDTLHAVRGRRYLCRERPLWKLGADAEVVAGSRSTQEPHYTAYAPGNDRERSDQRIGGRTHRRSRRVRSPPLQLRLHMETADWQPARDLKSIAAGCSTEATLCRGSRTKSPS